MVKPVTPDAPPCSAKMDIVQTDRVYFADVSFTVYWRVDFNDARGQRSVQRVRMSQRRDGFPSTAAACIK